MAKRRSNGQLARDRRRIADLYLQGWLQTDIAKDIGLDQSTVSRDIAVLQDEWRESALIDIDAKKAEELAKVDRLEREYWEAWERSCEDAQTVQQKVKEDGKKEATKTAKGQSGDPRFLTGIQWCINKRCEIIGIDAPAKHEVTGKVTNETKVNDDQFDRTISTLADAVGKIVSSKSKETNSSMDAAE